MQFDVFGIENPLIDLLVTVPDEFLDRFQVEKNKMYLIDQERHQLLLAAVNDLGVLPEPGGSCANTMLGIAQLGGRAAYCGKVGADDYGRIYIEKLEQGGVTSFIKTDGHLTGSTVILVTKDASRTMNTFLGACQELAPEDIPLDGLRSTRLLYTTGYLWDTETQQQAAMVGLNTAKEAGIPIAMSLADPFCVDRHKDAFLQILDGYVDWVFANQDEAQAITGHDNAHQALLALRRLCQGVVITLGAHGALVSAGEETVYIDPFRVTPVDTTGAGDAFAAGFLYGNAQSCSLHQCGRLGAYFAAQVIAQMGPRLSGNVRQVMAPVVSDPR
ncbi:MAG: adenosine kinase [SAR324 cluster bacterium]|nr:adenosine kinase [SAR324 cluster bacterium]